MRRDLVVVGASAGGIEAMRQILAALPGDFPAALCVVIHIAPDSPGILDAILDRAGPLSAVTVSDSRRLEHGMVYVARPDHHLVVEPSMVRAAQGPRENHFRPAIDPLFRSAAQSHGPRCIGVILTGGLDDGTSGLWAVKRLGGVAIVQDPDDALAPSMPLSAATNIEVDHCVPLAAIPELLVRLVRENLAEAQGYEVPEDLDIEVGISKQADPLALGVTRLGEPGADD